MAEKLKHLRSVEGQLRGLGRPLTKTEVARLMRSEVGEGLSLPYLSQIEAGKRPHLTSNTRAVLARFFRVHPSYLVDDPEGFEETIRSEVELVSPDLGEWLSRRAEEQREDPDLYEALLRLSAQPDPREILLAVGRALAAGPSRSAAASEVPDAGR